MPLIDARTPVDWLGEGGLAEDQYLGSELFGALFRSSRHFHTPLRSWDQAGLKTVFQSSVQWAQNPAQSPGGRAAWRDARLAFGTALTNPNFAERQQRFADTFRILGQLMHLVADVAVPAHSRDDLHILDDGFEAFMLAHRELITGFSGFDKSILLDAPNDPIATLPIARIWDTDRYTGLNPDVTASPTIGLAEFSSANFFSDDTISAEALASPNLPFPAIDRLVPGPTVNERQYLTKPGDGVSIERMVAKGLFVRFTPPFFARYTLDDVVFQDYAARLLPRAIGYASGLLDYFFRGRIEIAAPDKFVYGLAQFVDGNTGAFTKLTFKVRNVTPNEETTCPAGQTCAPPQLTAVVQYRKPIADAISQPDADLPAQLSFAVAQPQAVTLSRDFQELTFDFSASPIPTNAADVFLTVVYRGPLGLEAAAVAVGGKDLFEPDPVTVANVTDYFCFNGTLLHVADFTAFPPFNPFLPPDPLNPQPRDPNADGVQDIFGPADELGSFAKASSVFTFPSPSNFDEQVAQRTFAQFTRFFLLQDRSVYVLSRLVQTLVERGIITTPSRSNALFAVLNEGIVNRLVQRPDGTVVHEFTGSSVYRGLPTLGITIFLPQDIPSFLPCLGASFTVTPALTRIDDILAGP